MNTPAIEPMVLAGLESWMRDGHGGGDVQVKYDRHNYHFTVRLFVALGDASTVIDGHGDTIADAICSALEQHEGTR